MPPPASVMKLASAASSSVPLPNQISGAAVAGGAAAVVRDKKTGGNYSAAGDDDINDVAAMGGVNLAEEANVSINTLPSSLGQSIIFYRGILIIGTLERQRPSYHPLICSLLDN